MERFITDEKTGIEYELIGDYYYPCFKAPESPVIGKYGRMRMKYLKENKRVYFNQLILNSKLGEHLGEIDKSANDMMDLIVKQMVLSQGVTERLKAEDQMRWVGLMNNIKASAEEIILNDLIYA